MTDADITRIYEDALGHRLDPSNLHKGRVFIRALFDSLPVVGYIDGKTGTFHEEAWSALDPQPVVVRPKV
jgi:hypothetical protein